ncbi:MAG: AMP-binding protein [Rhodospirillales bacterium]|nr:AMP-binding protein [Rhodospirillales bacterium]
MTPTEAFLEARNFLLTQRGDYDRAYAKFRWPELDSFNWAIDWFDVFARSNNRPALWVSSRDAGETKLSFRELSNRSNQVANFLRGHGVRRGDRILLMLSNVVPFWETMLAAIKLGAVVIPATTMLTRDELLDRFERGDVRHVVAGGGDAGKFADIKADYSRIAVGKAPAGWTKFEDAYRASSEYTPHGPTPANAPLLLYFTSGTTAKPKLVEHTHQSYPVGHLSTMYWLGLREGDVHLNISAPGWAKHAWSGFFAPWNAGATVFVYNYLRFNAKTMLDVIVRHGVTSLCAPPMIWRQFVQEENLANYPVRLREIVSSGQPLDPEITQHVEKEWGLTLRDGYGQTETTAMIGQTPGRKPKAGSMGRPLPGYDVALLDAEGNEADEGEIAVRLDPRPAGLMLGYQDEWKKTVDPASGGYYRTGDVASRDADGCYAYVGRADDLFKASDCRISPFEIESVLIEHEAIAVAAVVPCQDALGRTVPKVVIELCDGFAPNKALANEIFRFALGHLAPYKRIRRVEFADVPKTLTGKIRRVDLRKRENDLREAGERGPLEFREEDFPALEDAV